MKENVLKNVEKGKKKISARFLLVKHADAT